MAKVKELGQGRRMYGLSVSRNKLIKLTLEMKQIDSLNVCVCVCVCPDICYYDIFFFIFLRF